MDPEEFERLFEEFNRDNAWLRAEGIPTPAPPDEIVECVKFQVRVALAEGDAGFDEASHPALSPQALERVKSRVREELRTQSEDAAGLEQPVPLEQPPQRKRRISYARWGALAAAAVLAVSVTIRYWPEDALPPPETVAPIEDFVAVMASASETGFDGSTWNLEEDVESLTGEFLFEEDSAMETEIDELEEELDRLLAESDAPMDT